MISKRSSQAAAGLLAALCLAGSAVLLSAAPRADQRPVGDVVGAITGEAIAVTGPMSVDVSKGQVRTILRSGADVRVKTGNARIELAEGGQISICGPAHLSVLKSGNALTVALEAGSIHAHIERDLTLTVYTPQIQAKPVAIAGGAQDVLIGFDTAGAMCVRADSGAVRLEQQLTAQAVIVPQGADVLITNARFETMRSGSNHCTCELQTVPSGVEVSKLATAEEIRSKAAEGKPRLSAQQPSGPAAAPKEEPIYQVFMPPLTYDATKKVQAEFDPNLIVLVRRVRVRPTLIFQGRVEGDEVVAQALPTPRLPSDSHATAPSAARKPAAPGGDDTVLGRVRTFWKKLWSHSS